MTPDTDAALADLVAANRILARHGIVDGYGHVSLRSPHKPDHYLLSRAIAPETVTAADIVEFDLDSRPTHQTSELYLERFIHGEIYRARPEVRAVVHNHAPSLIPFGVAATPL
ncbi:MAG: class II aldolase/adducin family protein, partial [Desulfurellaceae bacterium]|nr:class II aldolase/adducin family protein [Desulfurellaceae bacterium]